jgi:hypothetical protein
LGGAGYTYYKLQNSSAPNFLRLLLVINQAFGQAILGQTYPFRHIACWNNNLQPVSLSLGLAALFSS